MSDGTGGGRGSADGGRGGVLAVFDHLDATVDAVKELRDAGFEDTQTYAPYPDHHIEKALGYGPSPVRVYTLVGALTGTATGFAFTTWTSMDWPLVTGGKPIVSIPAYVVIAFELTILFGALATVIGLFIQAKLPSTRPMVIYDPNFSGGKYGIYVPATGEALGRARGILDRHGPAEVREADEGREVETRG
ncbi:MAG: DUF3341 domain-containing protein [Longimicrobiales bacterium]|nr:DUF3341 domain-containing protein [Longimicrobiales bacterium]